MADSDYVNPFKNESGNTNQDDHRNSLNTPKNGPDLFLDERTRCKCGARRYLDKYKRELDRRSYALDRDRQYLRQRHEELDSKEVKLSEYFRQLPSQQEELDSYKMYLQDKQVKIARMYQELDQAQSDLAHRMDYCSSLEKEYKIKVAELDSGLYEVRQKESMVYDVKGQLNFRRDELERLENRILQESEKVKHMQDQWALARERMDNELRQHSQRISEENEKLESRKKKLQEMEDMLEKEKHKLENSRTKSHELDLKLKEATDLVEFNSKLAEELRNREEALKREKEMLTTEWFKVDEAAQQLNNDRNEVNSIRHDLSMRSKQLELSRQPDVASQYSSGLNEARLKNMENDLNRKKEELKQTQQEVRKKQEELGNKQEELNEMTNVLNRRELGIKSKELDLAKLERDLNKKKLDLDEREKYLEKLKRELDRKNKELEYKKDKFKQLELQFKDYKDQLGLLSFDRNSLDGQIEQFNSRKMTTQQELDAIDQRLSLREGLIMNKDNLTKGKQNHLDLLNKLELVRNNKRHQPFSIADEEALN